MKKSTLLGLALTALALATTACSDNTAPAETATTTAPDSAAQADSAALPANPDPGVAAATYTCSMHPEIIANEPGKCPKCQMDLVKQ